MIKQHIFQKASLLALSVCLLFTSCSKNDDPTPDENNGTLEVIAVKDLDGYTKEAVYFSLEQGKEVEESSTDWDIKLSGTTISFGNEATGQLVEGIFASYLNAPENGFSESNIGGSNSYYTYTNNDEPLHTVLMKPGVLIIVKTGKGNYAKIEMISYYKGNPTAADMATEEFADYGEGSQRQEKWPLKHYTFNYVLQSDGSNKF